MSFNIVSAKQFVGAIDLRGTPRHAGILSLSANEATPVFDQAKAQAQIVGSSVLSFAQGVTADVREAISDSALLAQLVANKKASAEADPLAWFKAYSEVLQNVGWTLQESGWTDYSTSGQGAEVNEQVAAVMSAVLGPAASALSIITATISALKAMQPNNPWLTIFSRESQKARIARFQVGLVNTDPNGDVFVYLVACLIEADKTIVQVLFFKWRQAKASFRASSAKVSINKSALVDLGPAIRAKTRAYQADYVSSLLEV